MNTAFDILVIVLSCLLGIFLILSITTAVLILKLVKALREIIAKGEHLVDNAEAIGETLRRNAGAVSMVKLLMSFMGNRRGRGKG
ncbi:MAG TPA: hypothetical protein VGM08_01390 [Candidatus Saccharimonadales bacterium]|jgi:hypothetical protein